MKYKENGNSPVIRRNVASAVEPYIIIKNSVSSVTLCENSWISFFSARNFLIFPYIFVKKDCQANIKFISGIYFEGRRPVFNIPSLTLNAPRPRMPLVRFGHWRTDSRTSPIMPSLSTLVISESSASLLNSFVDGCLPSPATLVECSPPGPYENNRSYGGAKDHLPSEAILETKSLP